MRDWRRLPYWDTDVAVESTIGDVYKTLSKSGLSTYRVTLQPSPVWRLLTEWEQPVGTAIVLVAFDIEVSAEELADYTARQAQKVLNQAARLMWHTIKNLVAAHETGLLSLEQIFLSKMQMFDEEGQQVSVGDNILGRIREAGAIGPTITRLALPAPGGQKR